MDNTELDTSLEVDEGFAIEPVTVEVPVENRSLSECSDADDLGLRDVSYDSDDSDRLIYVEDEDMHTRLPLERCNLSSPAEGDEEFCIIYESYSPTPDVQVVANYRSPSVSKRNRKKRSQRQQDNSVTPENSCSLDDSVFIIDEIPPVKVNNIKINQESLLNSSEKKKRKIECGVCFDGPDDIAANGRNLVSTTCGHIFCNECAKMAIKVTKQCPQCRKKLTAKQYHPIYI